MRSITAKIAALGAAAYAAMAVAAVASPQADFRDAGRAPSTMPVRLAFTLAYRRQAELDALVHAQADRSSPLFRKFLTNDQFNAYFAPSAEQYARVLRTLRASGLTIAHEFGNHTVVDATGPSGAVERLFGTQIHGGSQAGHGARYESAGNATLPAALRGLVVTVTGLDNEISFAPRIVRTDPRNVRPSVIGGPLMGPQGGYGPLAFAQGYEEPVQQGNDGTGRSIANIMAGDIGDTDLSTYLAYFSITPAFPLQRIAVDGGNLGHDDVETTLDVEAMTGTAPGAQVYLYSFPEFTDSAAEDAYNQVVSDNLVDAANSSWGGCETGSKGDLGHAFAVASNKIFEQGAAKGITFPIATGDYGARTCHYRHGMLDETTADSDPYALAVGGTVLEVDQNGNYVSERGWHGSAGGVSILFPLPDYQLGVRNAVPSGRNIPDIALDAAPETGFAEYERGQWFEVAGTSMASPLWVGLEGQLDEVFNGRIGFVNPALYGLLHSPGYAASIHDITRGYNGEYRNLHGFDLVTGLGTPIGSGMATYLAPTSK